MENEIRQCQNCKKDFVIESEDFNFYEKIKVPPPTFCPECRFVRRLIWRNERSFKKEICHLCKDSILSMYDNGVKNNPYCQKCWWSDGWDPMDYGKDYDFSRSFFDQFFELSKNVPYMALQVRDSEKAFYSNFVSNIKNAYMSFSAGEDSENVMYSKNIDRSRNVNDCFDLISCDNCYGVVKCEKCFNATFIYYCRECIDSKYLINCVNCQNCFMSSNLRNCNFYFRNKKYSKEEYDKFMGEINFGSRSVLKKLDEEFDLLNKKTIKKFTSSVNCQNFSGDDLINSKNAIFCFSGYEYEDVKYIYRGLKIKDSMDSDFIARSEFLYEIVMGGGKGGQNLKFLLASIPGCSEIQYSHYCGSSSNLFGCIALRNKQYCILNKQYSKEEYEELVPKIIEHMNHTYYSGEKGRIYRYGEFFPIEFSPFGYNETVAQEYFPLTKEEALKQGYKWKDREERNYSIDIKNEEIPDNIKYVNESIINKVIECVHRGKCNEQCTEAFKIVEEEFSFYKNMNIPLPDMCPNCRYYQRLKQRNPLKLWHRDCMCENENHGHKGKCQNKFETSYSPDQSDIIYCDKCYKLEVY